MSMSYIYEMHRTLLAIQYVLPENHYCKEIRTVMQNEKPHDLTNLSMRYEVQIWRESLNVNENKIEADIAHFPFAKSLDELIEECRKWSIEKRERNEQLNVNKLKATGTPGATV